MVRHCIRVFSNILRTCLIEADSVAKYNIEIMRASRELLRWQQYFATGRFEDVEVEAPTESERRRNAEIDETLDLMTEGKKL